MEDRTNPAHYKDEAVCVDGKRYEPIDICECYNFCLGNAVKYIIRARHHKDGEKLNLEKARWYLRRLAKQDVLSYTWLHPEGDGRYLAAKILVEYRKKFTVLRALFEPSGAVCIVGIDEAIKLLNQRISELRDE